MMSYSGRMQKIVSDLLARRRRSVPAVGEQFNRLTFTGTFGSITEFRANRPKNPHQHKLTCECVCECGTMKFYRLKDLTNNHIRSCGCLQREAVRRTGRAGRERPPEQAAIRNALKRTWYNMLERCYDATHPAYPRYGERGIAVCEQWRTDFEAFAVWAAEDYQPHLTLDREDNDGPYSPTNCRWVTHLIQNRNRSNNRVLTAFGESKCLSEWLDDPRCIVTRRIMKHRLAAGIDAATAMTTPRQRRTFRRAPAASKY
jgi:hypothetical protein